MPDTMLAVGPSISFVIDGTTMSTCRITGNTKKNIAGGDRDIEEKNGSGNAVSDERIVAEAMYFSDELNDYQKHGFLCPSLRGSLYLPGTSKNGLLSRMIASR